MSRGAVARQLSGISRRLAWGKRLDLSVGPALGIGLGLFALVAGCGGSDGGRNGQGSLGMAPRAADGTILDDRALCTQALGTQAQGSTQAQGPRGTSAGEGPMANGSPAAANQGVLEVDEIAGPGALQPNVRRVWQVFGSGVTRRRVLRCREIDTNLDGYKDVVRFYNDEGQSKEERADTNFDGNIDTWNVFAAGRLAEVRHDRNFDGNADEWKVYLEGKLSRIKRDANFDGKPDVWEMYRKGRLERMGVDVDGDERVDRWDHDAAYRKRLEDERRKREEEEERRRKEREEELRRAAEEAF
ncbi:MAG: hypothetical protein AAF928_01535 [Myxococcota bacterium]